MNNLENLLTADEIRRHSDAALELMTEHKVAPTPENYQIWFGYVTRWNPDLSRALDRMIAENLKFTREINKKLFDDYFSTEIQGRALDAASNRLQEELAGILRQLIEVGVDASRFRISLETFSSQIDDDSTASQLAAVIENLVAETKNMANQSRKLETHLESSTKKIVALEENLQSVQRQVLTDGLTGIGNRKNFDFALDRMTSECGKAGDRLCLLMADIDHFKHFNDTWGHQLGDEVLRLVAQTLIRTIKGRDNASRYGGEEFVVILPHTGLEDAMHLAESIREGVASKRLTRKATGEMLGSITISIGVAEYRRDELPEQLVARADLALYKAKAKGRNQVIAADRHDQDGARSRWATQE